MEAIWKTHGTYMEKHIRKVDWQRMENSRTDKQIYIYIYVYMYMGNLCDMYRKSVEHVWIMYGEHIDHT